MPKYKEKKTTAEINGKIFQRALEVANRLGIAEWYLIKLGNTGAVPSVKLGRVRWFNYDDVLAARMSQAEKPRTASNTAATKKELESDGNRFAALDGI